MERDVTPLESARLEVTDDVLVDLLHLAGPVGLEGGQLLRVEVQVHWVHHVLDG